MHKDQGVEYDCRGREINWGQRPILVWVPDACVLDATTCVLL